MHSSLIAALPPLPDLESTAVKDALAAALAPFDFSAQQPLGPVYVSAERVAGLARWVRARPDWYGEAPDDDLGAASLYTHLPYHRDASGRAYYLGTDNPRGRWDGWRLGGEYRRFLLPEPGPEAGNAGNIAAGGRNMLRLEDLDWARMGERSGRSDRAGVPHPFALTEQLLVEGEWLERRRPWDPWTIAPMPPGDWDRIWCERLAGAPGDSVIAIVDFHW